ncbi:MAG: aminoglycoside 6'-N-acetyltransferase [Clostridiaceae bacterium]|nr:aminoglycoside 6'-N-acetyltransferase [Clostridiaceae bacterium]
MVYFVRRADIADAKTAAALALRLWPAHTAEELETEMTETLYSGAGAVFLAEDGGGAAVGFAECSLRHDYVEGTTSSPTGYLEGIYILPEHRRTGVAGSLTAACEAWARSQGCIEMASDCELSNTDSLRFHLGVGYREANRLICFVKPL